MSQSGRFLSGLLLSALLISGVVTDARSQTAASATPTIEAKTEGMQKIDGFFPLFWNATDGTLWMEISRFGTEVLHMGGLAAGLGSNDIGLDRGQLGGSRIVRFERVGKKIFMIQPNYRFRADSRSADEVKAVTDAFAESILWGFTVAAETDGRVLVDLSDFLIRDTHGIARRLRPGTYRLDKTRSAVYLPMTQGFPKNTEMEVTLTFTLAPGPTAAGGIRGSAFEGVGSVSASSEAVTLRVHQAFVELPDDHYETRAFDPRSGYGAMTYRDYAVPLGTPLEKRFINRHRLQKVDPTADISDPVEPIIYYLDRGTPEPIRSALLDGARWWNQAFEAAGYRNAFLVELLPEGANSLDIRYNMIHWAHRSTRGWSYGGSISDPRTGEIIKGNVTLGSLRVRQDYMIAEGLLAPYENGTETPPELAEWALARLRQLSAHEVGHTIGLGHNYYDSEMGRISVLDYPHPLVTLTDDGSLDYSEVYDVGIGEWDIVSVAYGYQDFPDGTDEKAALDRILNDAWAQDVLYLSNQDLSANPKVDQWSNGTDAAAELNRMMKVRRVALDRFGETAIRNGMPMATMEDVLVPLYMHHRFQVEAAGSAIGGIHYKYTLRGDGREPVEPVPGPEQTAALNALLATLDPAELTIPESVLDILPPRPPGYRSTRELFPRYTGLMFDAITPAAVAAGHTLSNILRADRAARVVEQHALDASIPGWHSILTRVSGHVFSDTPANGYEAEVARAIQRVFVDQLMALAANAAMPQVRAISHHNLEVIMESLREAPSRPRVSEIAHRQLIVRDIERFLNRPAADFQQPNPRSAPPGAPIGDPALDWLLPLQVQCSEGWQ